MHHIHILPRSIADTVADARLRIEAALEWQDFLIVILNENKFMFESKRATRHQIIDDVWQVAYFMLDNTQKSLLSENKNTDAHFSAAAWHLQQAWMRFKRSIDHIYPFVHNKYSDALARFICDPLSLLPSYTLFGIKYRPFTPLNRQSLSGVLTDFLVRVHRNPDFIRNIFVDNTYLVAYATDEVKKIIVDLRDRYAAADTRRMFFTLFENWQINQLLDMLIGSQYMPSNEEIALVRIIASEMQQKIFGPNIILIPINIDTYMLQCTMCEAEFTFDTLKTYKGTCGKCFNNLPNSQKPPNIRTQISAKDQREVLHRDFKGKRDIPCPVCEKPITQETKEFGHILAVARGGNSTAENLICICRICNAKMGAMNFYEYKQKYDANLKAMREEIKNADMNDPYATDATDVTDINIAIDISKTVPNTPTQTPLQTPRTDTSSQTAPNSPKTPPKKHKSSTTDKRKAYDTKNINEFLAKKYVPCKNSSISCMQMHDDYKRYCAQKSISLCGPKSFNHRLKEIVKLSNIYTYSVAKCALINNIDRVLT